MTHRLIQNGELVLYGPVGIIDVWGGGEGFTSLEVLAALAEMSGDIVVRLNSGGGVAFDGIAIHNALKARASRVTVAIDGIAASAASAIAMAGDEIVMRSGAMMMIHDASGITLGTASDHEKQASVLHKLDGELARIYAARSGKAPNDVRRMMDEETWLDGPEAVAAGFATAVDEHAADEPTAFDYRLYSRAPERLIAAAKKPSSRAQPPAIPLPTPPTATTERVTPMPIDLAALTAEQLRAARPDLVASLEASPAVSARLDAARAEADAAARTAERDRIAAIQAAAFPGQEALVAQLIADGKNAGEAAQALVADYKAKGRHARAIEDMDALVADVGAAPAAGAGARAAFDQTPEGWRKEWEATAALRDEFPTADAYVGYQSGRANGRLRILNVKAA